MNDDHFGYVQNRFKKPWVQQVKHVQHSQKAMLEDVFNLWPQVWVPMILLVQHALNNFIKRAH